MSNIFKPGDQVVFIKDNHADAGNSCYTYLKKGNVYTVEIFRSSKEHGSGEGKHVISLKEFPQINYGFFWSAAFSLFNPEAYEKELEERRKDLRLIEI